MIINLYDTSGDDREEMKVHSWLKTQLKKRYEKLWFYKAPGGRYGRKGVPDFLINIDGYFVAIEVKRSSGKITLHQECEAVKLDDSNALMVVMHGRCEEVFSIIDDYLENRQKGAHEAWRAMYG